jgi:hypothetical protein
MVGLSALAGRAARAARSSAGVGTAGAALSVAALTSLVLVGVGASRSGLRLGSGFAWLAGNGRGQATLVDGATGQATAKVGFDGGGRLEVRMFGDHAYVVQVGRDGSRVLYRLDDAGVSAPSHVPVGAGQTIARSAGRAWLVDAPAGTVEAVDPDGLGSRGRAFAFRGPILTAVDGRGHLVVVEEPTARAFVVADTPGESVAVGGPGDRLAVAAVADHAVVLDASRAQLHVFDGESDGAPWSVELPPGPGTFEVAPEGEGDAVVLLRRDGARGELVTVDLAGHAVRGPVAVEGDVARGTGPPLAVAGAVFLVDTGSGTAVVVDPATGRVRRSVPLGLPRGTAAEAFVKDGLLWVNQAEGARAVVVGADGRRRDVDKDDAPSPETDPIVTPDAPVPAPRPGPSPTPWPGPPGRGPGPDPGPGPGPGPAPGAGGTPPPVATAPGPPRQVRARAGDGSVALSWQTGADGGAPLLGYTLACSPDCGAGGERFASLPPGEAHQVTGLRNGTDYSFTLRARNALGESPPAAAEPDPVRPTAEVPPAPSGVQARANPDGTVVVAWDPAGAGPAATGYAITATSDSGAVRARTATFTAPAGARAHTVAAGELGYDDDADPDWSFAVAAVAGSVAGPAATSNGVDPYTRPAFPRGAALTARAGNGQVTLSWPPPAANGRAVRYAVTCPDRPCPAVPPPERASGRDTVTVTGLTNGERYRFTVAISNDAGPGGSITSDAVVPAGRPSLTIGATEATTDRVTVHFALDWAGPDGTCAVRGGPRGTVTCAARGTYEATGLDASKRYTVKLCATRGGDEGCDSVTVATKAPPARDVVIDTVSWMSDGGPGSIPICNGEHGAGSQQDPDDYNGHPDVRCLYHGRTYTAVCETTGDTLHSKVIDGERKTTNVWYRLEQGDYASAGWIKGHPSTLGLPKC